MVLLYSKYTLMPEVLGTSKSIWNFDPRIISGCCLWLDGADAISTASITSGTWSDKSVYANHATGGSTFLSVGAINSIPAVTFPAPRAVRLTTSVTAAGSTTSGFSVFFVAKDTTLASTEARFLSATSDVFKVFTTSTTFPMTVSIYAGAANTSSLTVANSTTAFLYSAVISSTFNQWINGTSNSTSGTTGTVSFSNLYIGNNSGTAAAANAFSGQMGEVIVYNQALTATQRQQVEGYLAWKWGLQASLVSGHPYLTRPPFAQAYKPTDITDLYIWLNGEDRTSMTPSNPTSGTQITKWVDKVTGYTFTPGAISTESQVNGQNLTASSPTYVTGGGLLFSNPTIYAYAGQALGIYGTSGANLFTVPTQNMTIVTACSPLSNTALRRICIMGKYPIPAVPNFIMGPEMGVSEGGILLFDLNGGTWTQINYNDATNLATYPYNSSAIPRVDVMTSASGATQWWWTNGTLNTFNNATSYTSSQSNYPVNYFFIGAYTNTVDGGRPFNGTIYEIMFYRKALTTNERQQVEGHLAWKWKFNTSLPTTHPYYKFPPNTVV